MLWIHNGILAQTSPRFVIAEIQAKELADKISAVAAHYTVKVSNKNSDWIALITVAAMIEIPMIAGYYKDQAEAKRQRTMEGQTPRDPLAAGATIGLDGLH